MKAKITRICGGTIEGTWVNDSEVDEYEATNLIAQELGAVEGAQDISTYREGGFSHIDPISYGEFLIVNYGE